MRAMRRAGLALFLLLFGSVACGSRERPTVGVPGPPEAADAGESDAGEVDGGAADAGPDGGGAAASAPEPPRPDPTAVKLALERTAQPTDIEQAPYGLRFEVIEQGPTLPWALAVVNRGTERVRVVFDPRLLRMELESPLPPPPEDPKKRKYYKAPKPKKIECALPEGIRPAKVDKRLVIELAPGEGMVEQFDPRLYCLPYAGKSPLEPGATIRAKLGWPTKTKTVWRKGKKVEEKLPQVAPFLAEPVEESTVDSRPSTVDKEPPPPPTKGKVAPKEPPVEVGVKELFGTPFTLGSEYAPPPPPAPAEPPPLELVLARGSDASSEETATVTVQVKNRSKERKYVFFRRELLSFEVSGPDGKTTCDPQPDTRAPDKQAFRLLNPGGALEATSRLIELCPDDTFARPGLYLAHARFEASATGEDFGIEAVTGVFVSEKPAVIRIRSGELPFLGTRVMQKVKVGEP